MQLTWILCQQGVGQDYVLICNQTEEGPTSKLTWLLALGSWQRWDTALFLPSCQLEPKTTLRCPQFLPHGHPIELLASSSQ